VRVEPVENGMHTELDVTFEYTALWVNGQRVEADVPRRAIERLEQMALRKYRDEVAA
jgi:hypothetical protein